MPSEELERTAEAVRRALPELIKLDRYESRAAARRDKAIRNITISTTSDGLTLFSPNEPNFWKLFQSLVATVLQMAGAA
jgi:hypothetical protein